MKETTTTFRDFKSRVEACTGRGSNACPFDGSQSRTALNVAELAILNADSDNGTAVLDQNALAVQIREVSIGPCLKAAGVEIPPTPDARTDANYQDSDVIDISEYR